MNYVHTGLEAVDEDEDDEQPEAKKRGRSDASGRSDVVSRDRARRAQVSRAG